MTRRSNEIGAGGAAPRATNRRRGLAVVVAAGIGVAVALHSPLTAAPVDAVDTALVLAVDVSGSVSAGRYRLQMEGIAAAFEDSAVQGAILAGPRRSLLITLVQWSDKAQVSVPWMLIESGEDAASFAAKVRRAPRAADQFTCMSQMMRLVADKVLPRAPLPADRTVIDVSGDGRDNCNPAQPVDALRDELVGMGVTINGLPILDGDEAKTLEGWYREHVIGGTAAFLEPAAGFADFARAMRQKFLVEISATGPDRGAGGSAPVVVAHADHR
jgi:hypothetical protein